MNATTHAATLMAETSTIATTTAAATAAAAAAEISMDVFVISLFFYIVIFVTGVIGNMLVIYVLIKERELRNFTNYLLANLSIADLMVLFTCVIPCIHDLFANNKWYLGRFMCYMFEFSQYCTSIVSILTIFLITLERYYVICRPLKIKSFITKPRTIKLIALIWLVSVFINLPLIFFTHYNPITDDDTSDDTLASSSFISSTPSLPRGDHDVEYSCEIMFDEGFTTSWHIYYIMTMLFLVYFLCGMVLIFMFYKISKNLKSSEHMLLTNANMSKALIEMNKHDKTSSPLPHSPSSKSAHRSILVDKGDQDVSSPIHQQQEQPSSHHTTNHLMPTSGPDMDAGANRPRINSTATRNHLEKIMKPRRQLIFMLMSVIIVFYVCVYPIKMLSLILVFYRLNTLISDRVLNYIVMVCRILFYMNSSINPILYNCLSKKFRASFRNLLIFRVFIGDAKGGKEKRTLLTGAGRPRQDTANVTLKLAAIRSALAVDEETAMTMAPITAN